MFWPGEVSDAIAICSETFCATMACSPSMAFRLSGLLSADAWVVKVCFMVSRSESVNFSGEVFMSRGIRSDVDKGSPSEAGALLLSLSVELSASWRSDALLEVGLLGESEPEDDLGLSPTVVAFGAVSEFEDPVEAFIRLSFVV